MLFSAACTAVPAATASSAKICTAAVAAFMTAARASRATIKACPALPRFGLAPSASTCIVLTTVPVATGQSATDTAHRYAVRLALLMGRSVMTASSAASAAREHQLKASDSVSHM